MKIDSKYQLPLSVDNVSLKAKESYLEDLLINLSALTLSLQPTARTLHSPHLTFKHYKHTPPTHLPGHFCLLQLDKSRQSTPAELSQVPL